MYPFLQRKWKLLAAKIHESSALGELSDSNGNEDGAPWAQGGADHSPSITQTCRYWPTLNQSTTKMYDSVVTKIKGIK